MSLTLVLFAVLLLLSLEELNATCAGSCGSSANCVSTRIQTTCFAGAVNCNGVLRNCCSAGTFTWGLCSDVCFTHGSCCDDYVQTCIAQRLTISTINPSILPVTGGLVTITGTFFGDASSTGRNNAYLRSEHSICLYSATDVWTSCALPGTISIVRTSPGSNPGDSQLVFTAPAGYGGSGAYRLKYKYKISNTFQDSINNNGQVYSLAANTNVLFRYASPTISNVAPLTVPTPGGTTMSVTGTNFAPTTTQIVANGVALSVTYVSSTLVTFNSPAGVGLNIPIFVRVSNVVNGNPPSPLDSTSLSFSYSAPTISQFSPVGCITSGGCILTFSGTNFGATAPVVRFGTVTASPPTLIAAHTQLSVTVPAGSGGSAAIVVMAGGQTSNSIAFNYLAPTITGVSTPAGAPTAGGVTITISGTSFGILNTPATTFAYVQGLACPITVVTHTSISCTLPAGRGVGLSVTVVVSGLSSPAFTSFSYSPPTISSVSPAVSTNGGSLITVFGTNFGTTATVTVAGISCPVTPGSCFHTSLTCTAPAGQGTGIPVVVTLDSRSFTFNANLYIAPSVSSVSPTSGVTSGAFLVTIVGLNFGTTGSVVFGSGSIAGVNSFSCPVTTGGWSQNRIVCTLSQGQGSNLPIVVTVAGQSSSSSVSFFNYSSPTLSSVSALTGNTQGAAVITLVGTNFGVQPTVMIGVFACVVASSSHTQIIVTTGAGSGVNLLIKVTVGSNQVTFPSFFSYNAPNLVNANPVLGSTTGGYALTINGLSFGSVTGTVKVNNVLCNPTFWTHLQIICTVPASQGSNVPIQVFSALPLTSVNSLFFSYLRPTVTGITPIVGATTGQIATIAGLNFGLSTQTVTVGGVICPLRVGATQTQTSLIVDIPAGSGANLPVVVTVASQSSTDSTTFSFNNPIVLSLAPASFPTVGGVILTITGSNFFTSTILTSVQIGSVSCPILSVAQTLITCTVPKGQGSGFSVTVSVNGLSGTSTSVVGYNVPVITNVSPQGGATGMFFCSFFDAKVGGGSVLTITGSNLGDQIAAQSLVAINGANCPVLSINLLQTILTCTLPIGTGVNLNAQVTVSSQVSASSSYSYGAPFISSVTPQGGSTAGGILVTILGSNFGVGSLNTITVLFGSSSCIVNSRNDGQLVVVLPTGEGTGVPVTVSLGSQISNILTYSYGVPVANSRSPVTGGTLGGTLVTIVGLNFGVSPTVSIGGNPCSLSAIGASSSQTRIVCASPPGQGLNQDIFVTASGQASNSLKFSYFAPTISGISPTFGPTQGSNIVITGNNLGLSGLVLIGGNACLWIAGGWTHTSVSCTAPAGSGQSNAVTLSVGGQIVSASLLYAYSAPTLSSIRPSTGTAAGGSVLTIDGTSFDSDGAVFISNVSCVVTSWSHVRIIAVSPPGVGISNIVRIQARSGLAGTNTLLYRYTAPSVISTIPSTVPTSGNVIITVTGADFGAGAIVTVGGNNCPVITVLSSSLTCTVPQGIGSVSLTVTVGGQVSNVLSFSYNQPTVTSISPLSADTFGGSLVTIFGSSFGVSSLAANGFVTFGSTTLASFISWTHSQIVFNAPSGQGVNIQVLVSSFGRLSNSIRFDYSAPFIISINPIVGASLSFLTITGTSFGISSPGVSISGQNALVQSFASGIISTVVVVVPMDSGINAQVVVTAAGQQSNVAVFSYNPPTISNVSPRRVSTAGFTSVTIFGTGFSLSGAVVTFRLGTTSRPCTGVAQTDSQITCQAPTGDGFGYDVIVTISGQSATFASSFGYLAPVITSVSPVFANTEARNSAGRIAITLTGSFFGSAPSVTIGGVACSVITGSGSQSAISVNLPDGVAGNLVNLAVVLTSNAQVGNATQRFSYNPPVITSLQYPTPTSAPTTGGILLTILGSSFSLNGGLVTISGNICTSTPGASHNRIECIVPPGRGVLNNVVVTVSGQPVSSNIFNYAYDAPVIDIFPKLPSADAVGGSRLALRGINFGSVLDSNLFVYFGPIGGFIEATIISVNDTVIVFSLPAAVGNNFDNIDVRVKVMSQLSLPIQYSYNGPVVTSLQSISCTQSLNALVNCPFGSVSTVTIFGSNFGDITTSPSVTIGGKVCSGVAHNPLSPYSQLTCSAPLGTGTNLAVVVSVAGKSGSANLFSYAVPTITSNTLQISGSAPSSSLSISSSAITAIKFSGTNLLAVGGVTTVTFGPFDAPTTFLCDVVIALSTSTSLTCNVPASTVGKDLVFQVSVFLASIGTMISSPGTDTISFPTPTIVPCIFLLVFLVYVASISRNGLPPSTSVQGILDQNEEISFRLNHGGNDASKLRVYYGTVVTPTLYSCNSVQVSWNSSSDVTFVSCLTSQLTPGEDVGQAYKFVVKVLNTFTIQGSDSYFYPVIPTVLKVSGCVDLGNTTNSCPTVGGNLLTITGTAFAADMSVNIGIRKCGNLVFLSSTLVQCVLPASAGLSVAIYATVGSKSSFQQPYLSYSQAVLSSLSGCSPDLNGNLVCLRGGGNIITIYGSNFGVSLANVLIGGISCLDVVHDVINPDQKLTCTLPPPRTPQNIISMPVLLIQSGGTISTNQLQISYDLCPPGTIADSVSILCTPCKTGFFSDTFELDTCKECLGGTYSNVNGSSFCASCSPGYFSSNAASICSICSSGKFSLLPPLSECISCNVGTFASTNGSSSCSACFNGLHSSNSGSSSCSSCTAGKFSASSAASGVADCTLCPAGYFSFDAGANSCTVCPAGQFTPDNGRSFCDSCLPGFFADQPGQKTCSKCSDGYFTNTTGLSFCFQCQAGSFAKSGASSCSLCSAGAFVDSAGAAGCISCNLGQFSDKSGSSTCISCPSGTASSTLFAVSCSSCSAGSFAFTAGSLTCSPCAAGSNSSSGAAICSICPAGTYQFSTGTSSCISCSPGEIPNLAHTACAPCPSGHYSSNVDRNKCVFCPAGKYSSAPTGATGCTDCPINTFSAGIYESAPAACLNCPLGQIQPTMGSTSCLKCQAGKFGSVCEPCPVNTYQPLEGSPNCIPCPLGFSSSNTGATACSSCDIGTYRNSVLEICTNCSAGAFAASTGQISCALAETGTISDSRTTIKACDIGTYSNAPGSTACTLCPAGSFSNSVGTVECTKCSEGTFSNSLGATVCTNCPIGSYTDKQGKQDCDSCAAGSFYGNLLGGAKSCTSCPPGTFSNSSGATFCYFCSPGYYQDNSGQSYCLSCKEGTFSNDFGVKLCANCLAGTYSNTAASTCQACEAGSYSSITSSSCIPCGTGTFSSTTNSPSCRPCPAGRYNTLNGVTACTLCAPGTFTAKINSTCTSCPIGKYQDVSGQQFCLSCPAGSFSNGTGFSVCLKCSAGSFVGSSSEGASACSLCEVGAASTNPGLASCVACDDGYYSDSVGSSSCKPCAVGSIAVKSVPSMGLASCTMCEPGQFGADSLKQCLTCPSGKFSALPGSPVCTSCIAGTYQDKTGSQNCNPCDAGKYSPVDAQSMHFHYFASKSDDCLSCPPGRYSLSGSSSCSPCSSGSYQNIDGQSSCVGCLAGTYASSGEQTVCQDCPAGFFSSNSNAVNCSICFAGSYSISVVTASTGKRSSCILCAPGQFSAGDGAYTCFSCPAGTFSSGFGSTVCSKCPSGTVQATPGSSNCTKCDLGSNADPTGQFCNDCPARTFGSSEGLCNDCPAGTANSLSGQSICPNCPAGTVSTNTGSLSCISCPFGTYGNGTICVECPAGSYSNNAFGASSCVNCPLGTSQPNSGQSACLDCADGYYSAINGSENCLQCGPGSFSLRVNPFDVLDKCSPCKEGTSNSNSGADSCPSCQPGKFSSILGSTSCTPCISGTISKNIGQASCDACEAGTFVATNGSWSCVSCGLGVYSSAGASLCTNCPIGSAQASDRATSCAACIPGTYMPITGQIACLACPTGSYNDQFGLTFCNQCLPGSVNPTSGSSFCEKCYPGQYMDVAGQIQCRFCSVGSYSNSSGFVTCNPCPSGTYQNVGNQSFCFECPHGQYQPNFGSVSCLGCRLGEYSDVRGLSTCFDCPVGKFGNDVSLTTCQNCVVGKFTSFPHQAQCVDCGVGTYASIDGLSSCPGCPSGTFGNLTGSTFCNLCGPGTFSILAGQSSCFDCHTGSFSVGLANPSCTLCPRGQFQNQLKATNCKLCPPGSGTESEGGVSCQTCLPGKFSNVYGSPVCPLCTPGTFNNKSNQTSCINCDAGKYSSAGLRVCNLCPIGTYTALGGFGVCTDCSVGFFQATPGQTSCLPCPAGFYTDSTRSAACRPCPIGTYNDGAIGASSCTPCPTGTYGNSVNASSCVECPLATYSDTLGAIICTICPHGTKSAVLPGAKFCPACPSGTFQSDYGKSYCIDCFVGSFASSEGSITCESCPKGSYSGSSAGLNSCPLCPAGKYQSLLGQTSCLACDPGTYSNGDGSQICLNCPAGFFQANASSSSCSACAPGTFQIYQGQTSCTPCGVGYYSSSQGSANCAACEIGTYSNVISSSVCSACSAGFMQDKSGQTSCVGCSIGKFTSVDRSVDCNSCPLGYFNTGENRSNCLACPAGSISNSSGTSCINCKVGTFTPIAGSATCISCKVGFYANDPNIDGQTSCSACPSSYFSNQAGTINCTFCPAGTVSLTVGQSLCTPCAPGTYWNFSANPGSKLMTSFCSACPAGYFSGSSASSSCSACNAGYSTNGGSGLTTCFSCNTNRQVSLTPGSAVCQGCPPNAISSKFGTFCECMEGFYYDPSISDPSIQCVQCPVGFSCLEPGVTKATLRLSSGYWRSDDVSMALYKCLVTGACAGGTYKDGRILSSTVPLSFSLIDSGDSNDIPNNSSSPSPVIKSTCASYHQGPLCAVCETGSQKSSSGICSPCPSRSNSIVFFVFVSIAIIIALVVEMTLLLKTSSELLHEEKEIDEVELAKLSRDDHAAYLKYQEHANLSREEKASQKVMNRLMNRIRERNAGKVVPTTVDEDDLENKSEKLNFRSDFTDSRQLLRQMSCRAIGVDEAKEDELAVEDEVRRGYKSNASKVYNEDGTTLSTANDITWKMKIIFGFFQIVTNMAIALQVPWPDTFLSFIRVLSVINFDFVSISSADCVVETGYYRRFLISILVPLAIVAGLLIFYLLPKYLITQFHPMHPQTRQNAERELGRCLSTVEEREYKDLEIKATRKRSRIRFYRMLQFFLFLIYPTVSSNVLRIFVCLDINGVSYLFADMSQVCHTSTWNSYAVIGAIFSVIYPVGIPAFFFYRLYTHRNRLEASSVRAENGFIFDGYSQEAWFFELVDMSHKLILTSILAFAPISGQLIFGMVIIISMILIILVIRPYKSKGDDRLHLVVQIELFLLLLCGFCFQKQVGASSALLKEDVIMSYLLIIMCIFIFLYFIAQVWRFLRKYYRSWYDRNHPDELEMRILRSKILDYKYVDRLNLFDADDAAKAAYERKQHQQNIFSADGAKMAMNPLFSTEANTTDLNETHEEAVQGTYEDEFNGIKLTKNVFFRQQIQPEQISR